MEYWEFILFLSLPAEFMNKKSVVFIAVIILVLAYFIPTIYKRFTFFIEGYSLKPPPKFKNIAEVKGISNVQPTLVSGKIKYPHDYTIVMLGDSMTEKLGNSDELKGYLNQYYPDKTFEVLNYGFGSTNIISAQERLTTKTFHGREFRPILDIAFDLILIESFGHNPLSQFPIQEGLQKQNLALDEIIQSIQDVGLGHKIVFVATVAPNKLDYAKGNTDLSGSEREKWAKERDLYIENHIKYAKDHNIPVVDVYDKSKDSDGNGRELYIDQSDHIHPSPKGVLFISKEIAGFIAQNRLLGSN